MADIAISTHDLTKRYSSSAADAVHRLNIDVAHGEIYGFLGPNGAGKSTAIRLLLNFIRPSRGSAVILGMDSITDSVEIKKSLGYLAGEIALYPKMTGRQFLDYMAELQPPQKASYAKDLARRFQANLSQPIRDLSKGNRQKIGIIQAFAHQPKVLILDEPTSGLDPLMQEQFFELIREVRDAGAAVFVSSHNLSEVKRMCDRVGFIRGGELIAEQSLQELAKTATQTFDIYFVDKAPVAELKRLKGTVQENSPKYVTVKVVGDLSPLFALLARHKVHAINQQEVDLEREFLEFYKEDKK